MISNHAKAGFDSLLTRSLKSGLSTPHACVIEQIDALPKIDRHESVVLTISSYVFRLMVMIHFNSSGAARQYMARLHDEEQMDDQAFYDSIAEFGNLSCGILNRDLGTYFPHLGMSTPNYIGGECMTYLEMLAAAHCQHFAMSVDGEPLFYASLCVKAYEAVHFEVNENEEIADTGELELF